VRVACVYTDQNATSRQLADRCVSTADEHGIIVRRYPSVYWAHVPGVAAELGLALRLQPHHHTATTTTHCPAFRIANGLTHYQLYTECVAAGEPICIVEHDAVFLGPLPRPPSTGVLQVSSHRDGQTSDEWYQGATENGRHTPAGDPPDFTATGVIPHPFVKLVGTSGYIITPRAAAAMVAHIQAYGVAYADCVTAAIVGDLWLANPQPVEMRNQRTIPYYA